MVIPSIEIFVRHSADCKYVDDERWKSCRCRKHLRWSWEGKQYRQTAKSRSWAAAERARRELELKYEAVQLGKPITDDNAATVEQAVAVFMAEKTGGKASASTLAKYKLTLARLQEFCDRHNLHFIREITLSHLSSWRAEWSRNYSSAFALRNNQSRVRHFFRYCKRARIVTDNPALDLSTIKISEDDYEIQPFTETQYRTILKTIPTCSGITERNRERVHALMQLQRWSGLSLVDAVCLGTGELIKVGDHYRVDTSRRKTGSRVSNVIPGSLGRELLKVKSGNRSYFFWSGETTTKGAVSTFDKIYRKIFEHAGIVEGGSHRFRHLFAVSLLEKGVDIRLVSKALGHKSLAVTERFYARWNQEQQGSLASALTRTWASRRPS